MTSVEKGNNTTAMVNQLTIPNRDEGELDIRKIQEENEEIMKVRTWISEGKRPEHTQIAEASYFLKSLWSQWPRLDVRND